MIPTNASPYAFLGFKRNPFGELSPAERGDLAVVDLREILRHLKDSRPFIQIIGNCGRGKTTHLLALKSALPGAVLLAFPENGPRPSLPPVSCPPASRPSGDQSSGDQSHGIPALLIDEAQRVSFRQMRTLLRYRVPLVVATHEDMSDRFRQSGFSVLSIDLDYPKTPVELARILNRRIAASRLSLSAPSQTTVPTLGLSYAEKLIQRFGSDVRGMEHFLYQDLQDCVTEGKLWLPVI